MILLWIVSIILTALFVFLKTWDMAVFGVFFFVFSSIQLLFDVVCAVAANEIAATATVRPAFKSNFFIYTYIFKYS